MTVFASNKEETRENVTENVTENRTKHILEAIRNNPKITTVILSWQFNIARMTLHRDLVRLKKSRNYKTSWPC